MIMESLIMKIADDWIGKFVMARRWDTRLAGRVKYNLNLDISYT